MKSPTLPYLKETTIQSIKVSFLESPLANQANAQLKNHLQSLPSSTNGPSLKFLVSGTQELLGIAKIANSGLKKIYKDSLKESGQGPDVLSKIPKASKKLIVSTATKLDSQIFKYIHAQKPLTQKMFDRLLRLEASGDIQLERLSSRQDLWKELSTNSKKLQLSKYDCRIIKRLSEKPSKKQSTHKRIQNLLKEDYIKDENGALVPTQKFIKARDELIKRGLLDDRDRSVYEAGNKSGRTFKRNLPIHQVQTLCQLKTFGNMTEAQLESTYNGEKYFQSDMNEMLKKNLIKKELKTINGQDFNLYHLSDTGNSVAEKLTGIKNKSRAYTKNEEELLHDLLQYEAYKIVSNRIKNEGGEILNVTTDRAKRSEIYTKNFKDIGDLNKQNVSDLEIAYKDKYGKEQTESIEIDRGYDASVIRKKSSNNPNLIWFTDSQKQYNTILSNAKHVSGLFLIKW